MKPAFGYQQIRTDRDNEYEAFSRVTRELQHAQLNGGNQRYAAIERNLRLWTVLASDLSEPSNQLPDELKAGLLSLAIFSLRQGYHLLQNDDDLESLIFINKKIMSGLRGDLSA